MTTLSLTGAILYQHRHQAGLCLSPIRVWPTLQLSLQISTGNPNAEHNLFARHTVLKANSVETYRVLRGRRCLKFIFLELILELFIVKKCWEVLEHVIINSLLLVVNNITVISTCI